jgi:hypothetical protein
MSSSKATAVKVAHRAKPARPKPAAGKAAKPSQPSAAVAVGSSAGGAAASDEALRLAAVLEQALADGRLDVLTPEALQSVFAALCKLYSANVEQGAPYLPVTNRSTVTPTDVMVVASKLLRATNLQVFELGMWQSWTGR